MFEVGDTAVDMALKAGCQEAVVLLEARGGRGGNSWRRGVPVIMARPTLRRGTKVGAAGFLRSARTSILKVVESEHQWMNCFYKSFFLCTSTRQGLPGQLYLFGKKIILKINSEGCWKIFPLPINVDIIDWFMRPEGNCAVQTVISGTVERSNATKSVRISDSVQIQSYALI